MHNCPKCNHEMHGRPNFCPACGVSITYSRTSGSDSLVGRIIDDTYEVVELAGEGDGDAASDHLRQDKEAARDAVRKVEEEGGGGDEEGRAKGVAVAGAPAAPPEAAVVAHRAAKPGEESPGGAVAWARGEPACVSGSLSHYHLRTAWDACRQISGTKARAKHVSRTAA